MKDAKARRQNRAPIDWPTPEGSPVVEGESTQVPAPEEQSPKYKCPSCGGIHITTFNAGGYVQARCEGCKHTWPLAVTRNHQTKREIVDTPAGPIVRPRTTRILEPVMGRLDFEDEGFRNPNKNYSLGDPDEW